MVYDQQATIKIEELSRILEPLIRRVVREELIKIAQKEPDLFYLDPEMPLYDDMLDLKRRKDQGYIELFAHKEVFSE
jgi:hypothetical protein